MLLQIATAEGEVSSQAAKRIGGWSESWYFDGSYDTTLAALNGPGKLCELRAALLPIGGQIVGQRLQQITPTMGPTAPYAKIFPASSGYETDVPSMCLQINCPATDRVNTKRFLMRGLPDSMVVKGEYQPKPDYKPALQAFISGLAGWRFRGTDFTNDLIEIDTVSALGEVVTKTPHGIPPGATVKIKMVKQTLNDLSVGGTFVVGQSPTTTTFTVFSWPYLAGKGGKVRRYEVTYPAVSTTLSDVYRVTTRKVGRPSGQYVGRR